MKNKLFIISRILWWILAIIGIGIIFILNFTNWRPIQCIYADEGNSVAETLAFSYIAAMLFYLFNDVLPQKITKDVAHRHIQRNLWRINENLRVIVEFTEPFKPFNLINKRYDIQTFTKVFREKNLCDRYTEGGITHVEGIRKRKNEIEKICEDLLSSYNTYMSIEEITYVDRVLNSYFISNNLEPIDFSAPEDCRHAYPNNQEEVGKSIFELYSLRCPLDVYTGNPLTA